MSSVFHKNPLSFDSLLYCCFNILVWVFLLLLDFIVSQLDLRVILVILECNSTLEFLKFSCFLSYACRNFTQQFTDPESQMHHPLIHFQALFTNQYLASFTQ